MNSKDCARLLMERDDILLLTHKNPDGDTVGSAAALCSALRRKGKRAWLYPNAAVTEKLRAFAEAYFTPADFAPAYVVAVDVATEGLFAAGFSGRVDLCIDHHPTNSHYARKELIASDRAACGEIVLELIKALCGKPNREEAELLYIAVSTDTGCFQYANTKARTLRAAAELLEYGADNSKINQLFFRKLSRPRLKLEGMVYEGMRFFHEGRVSLAVVTLDMLSRCGAAEDDLDDLAGLAGRAEGSLLSLTVREMEDGSSKISARSGPEISSSEICAVFGGGGHAMAAGCTIQEPPEKACRMLMTVVDEVFR